MTENMKKYLELISKDEKAQKKLNEQEPASIQEAKEKIIKDAAEKGITLSLIHISKGVNCGVPFRVYLVRRSLPSRRNF